MLLTLHSYILRELLKTFALATIALTVLLTMGGGLYSLLRFEGLEARDVPLLTPLLLPVMLAVSMGAAGLFAACMCYGRFAADNEFTACRAAGINVHRLMLAAFMVAVFVALIVLVAVNILIPQIVITIENYARNNLGVLAASRLESRTFLDLVGKEGGDWHLLTTESVQRPSDDELRKKGFEVDPRIHYLLVERPRYLQRGGQSSLERFLSAEWGFCVFDARTNPIRMRVTVKNAHQYDPAGGSAFLEELTIGPFEWSFGTKLRPSFVNLATLFSWLKQPWTSAPLRDQYEQFRSAIACLLFSRFAEESMGAGEMLELADDQNYTHELKAAGVTQEDQRLILQDASVQMLRSDGVPLSRYEAPRAELSAALPRRQELLSRPGDGAEVDIRLRLTSTAHSAVREFPTRSAAEPRLHDSISFGNLRLPEIVAAAVRDIQPATLLNPHAALRLNQRLDADRAKLIERSLAVQYNILALVHWRFALAAAILISILIAATMGAAFKGAHALSAFALACVPAFAVALLTYFGKDVAQRPSTHTAGLWLMWGGLGGVALLEWLLLRVLVRR